ncbi:MAG: GNAT family N-acetyltransferase [Trichocoleus desertorum ATA4-8-CV12]|jgi:GNAT superfamily N-acetyltransferase|nr:GNAT family N-acetyltransferase [Trichocoleus desertorum ATA4-8-CV12]
MTEAIEQIRVATEVDIDNLANLIAAFRDHLDQQLPYKTEILSSLRKLLIEDVEFLLASTGSGVAVAYTQVWYYYSLWSTGFEAQIEDLFVLPVARGRGIGARLVERAVCRAREHGCHLIVLNTNERNIEALRLYTKIGFVAERSRWEGGRQLWLEMPL